MGIFLFKYQFPKKLLDFFVSPLEIRMVFVVVVVVVVVVHFFRPSGTESQATEKNCHEQWMKLRMKLIWLDVGVDNTMSRKVDDVQKGQFFHLKYKFILSDYEVVLKYR